MSSRRRRLGQHFLRSERAALELLDPLEDAKPHEVVAEIGTGRGALTRRLADGGSLVVSVELDRDLCAATAAVLGPGRPWNLELVCGDAYRIIRRFDYLISSPPYSESSDTVEWLASKDFRIASLVLQEDFVRKALSDPSDRRYGAISAFVQLAFRAELGSRVPSSAFSPPPKVDSRVVLLRPRVAMSEREARWVLSRLRALFSHRKNALSRLCRELGCGWIQEENIRVRELAPKEALAVAAAIPAER